LCSNDKDVRLVRLLLKLPTLSPFLAIRLKLVCRNSKPGFVNVVVQ
jgi:hypothetical protein